MPVTDTTEKGLESLIVTAMIGSTATATEGLIHDENTPYDETGWLQPFGSFGP